MREVTSQDYFEPVTLKDIEEAYERVKGVVKNTPLERSSSNSSSVIPNSFAISVMYFIRSLSLINSTYF